MMGEPCQIWLSDTMYCVVDPIDFEWAKRWKWHPTKNSTGKKFYATRMTRNRAAGRQIKIYLHKEILARAGKKPRLGRRANGRALHPGGRSAAARRGEHGQAFEAGNRNVYSRTYR